MSRWKALIEAVPSHPGSCKTVAYSQSYEGSKFPAAPPQESASEKPSEGGHEWPLVVCAFFGSQELRKDGLEADPKQTHLFHRWL